VFGVLLRNFTEVQLIQVIQGAAVTTMILNIVALWKQEARDPSRTSGTSPQPGFWAAWQAFTSGNHARRRLVAVALGTAGFSMQDVLLEPYGGQILGLTVGQTTGLTALLAVGGLTGFLTAARQLDRGADPYRVAALGALVGVFAFAAVILAAPLMSVPAFAVGVALIGLGGGLFAHATLTAAMSMARESQIGLALGIWSAVQATAAGAAIALGGILRDVIAGPAVRGEFGVALASPATGYGVVYNIEIVLLFATLVAIGPLVRISHQQPERSRASFGLAEFPG
jgi:BCD family chlorophyll transporter-like MFS transporter